MQQTPSLDPAPQLAYTFLPACQPLFNIMQPLQQVPLPQGFLLFAFNPAPLAPTAMPLVIHTDLSASQGLYAAVSTPVAVPVAPRAPAPLSATATVLPPSQSQDSNKAAADTTNPRKSDADTSHKPANSRRKRTASVGVTGPSFKRCGRRPMDLTPEQFEQCYGPRPTHERVCTHCGITDADTPQWRRGPDGTACLCNRCGVRFRAGTLVPKSNFPFLRKLRHVAAQERRMEGAQALTQLAEQEEEEKVEAAPTAAAEGQPSN